MITVIIIVKTTKKLDFLQYCFTVVVFVKIISCTLNMASEVYIMISMNKTL